MSQPPRLTDRSALALRRARACEMGLATFLQDIARDEIEERRKEVNRTFTASAIVTDFPDLWTEGGAKIIPADETLALEPGAHDFVLHAMSLHWADDPLGQIIQCRRALKPDGLFMSVAFGGQTLQELRTSLATAEINVTGGLSPRVLPMADVRDMGGLLQRAGLALPVADTLPQRVSYADIFALMRDLRAMGETNALTDRLRHPTRREIFAQAAEIYAQTHALEEGRVFATFELIFLAGWAPSEDQPKPLRPGSATTRLSDALGSTEIRLPDGGSSD